MAVVVVFRQQTVDPGLFEPAAHGKATASASQMHLIVAALQWPTHVRLGSEC